MTSTADIVRPAVRHGPIIAFGALSIAVGGALLPFLATGAPLRAPFHIGLPAMILITGAAELMAVHRHDEEHTHTLSISEAALVFGLAFAAPLTVILGRAASAAMVYGGYRRIAATKVFFNTALFLLETTVAAVVYRAVLGQGDPVGAAGWLGAALAVAAASALGFTAVRAVMMLLGHPPEPGTVSLLATAMTAAGTAAGMAVAWMAARSGIVAGGAAVAVVACFALFYRADQRRRATALIAAAEDAARRPPDEWLGAIRTLLRVRIADLVLDHPTGDSSRLPDRDPAVMPGTVTSIPVGSPDGTATGRLAVGGKLPPHRTLTIADRALLTAIAARRIVPPPAPPGGR